MTRGVLLGRIAALGETVPDHVEALIAKARAALEGRQDPTRVLIGLATMAAFHKRPSKAAALAREALSAASDAETRTRARAVLASLLPNYHVPMMNDPRRNPAWDSALRRAIRPGMLAVEIGAGAGMLALMAARAGAQVVTTETNAVAASLARELAALNGLADRITVLHLDAKDLRIGEHLQRPADLLFCDIFADNLFDFRPLGLIGHARCLLAPDAAIVPGRILLRAALARWSDYDRSARAETACGFDISPLADFIPQSQIASVDSADLQLMSDPVDLFAYDLNAPHLPGQDRTAATSHATTDGIAHAIVRWIRLELDAETAMEAAPGSQPRFFSSPQIVPLERPVEIMSGQRVTIGASHNDHRVACWLAD